VSKAKDDDEMEPSGDDIDNQDQHSKTIRDRSVRRSGMFGTSEGVVGLREVCRIDDRCRTRSHRSRLIMRQFDELRRNRSSIRWDDTGSLPNS
jgi:hypothetical protein